VEPLQSLCHVGEDEARLSGLFAFAVNHLGLDQDAALRYHGLLPLKKNIHAKTGAFRLNLTFRKQVELAAFRNYVIWQSPSERSITSALHHAASGRTFRTLELRRIRVTAPGVFQDSQERTAGNMRLKPISRMMAACVQRMELRQAASAATSASIPLTGSAPCTKVL
jgi:hypothetical protein